ncbi:MAG: alpha/beta hydrolase [Bacteroidetes bacterium]|nr:alpha/beta hydrolase [Bacteroidota bacterium]
MKFSILFLAVLLYCCTNAGCSTDKINPVVYTYKTAGADSLKVYIFFPPQEKINNSNPAIVIFHGGGWALGEPSWTFERAEKYAKMGMVAVAAQYRLSDRKSITPIDAMEDTRDVILWMRKNSDELKISKNSIVAYGWSAGAHLAACTAVFPSHNPDSSISSIPDALILHSPAVSVVKDEWFKRLLLGKAEPFDYSPAEHIKENMPPSIIVTGENDTVTPLEQSELFHNNMLKYGNKSYLYVYKGVGHMFTPSGQPDDGWPRPDKETEAKAFRDIKSFLKNLKFIQ